MKKFKRLIMLTAIFVMLFGINVYANDEADTNDKEIIEVQSLDEWCVENEHYSFSCTIANAGTIFGES